ncbi:hypothetical protein GIX45_16440 [Erwinia sp. CPCC 100877]|nr:hypothetical protein [Erwinia sp. CPCC 100877]
MKTATLIYQQTPLFGANPLPTGNVIGMFKQKKMVAALNQQLQKQGLQWRVCLDQSVADSKQLMQESQALLCAPGLQKQFDSGAFDPQNIFYFDAVDYYNLDVRKAVSFLAVR